MGTNEQALTEEQVVTDCKLKQPMKMSQFILGTSLICEHLCTVLHTVLTRWLAAHCPGHRFPSLRPGSPPGAASQEQWGKKLV